MRILAYIWAGPTTLIGLPLALLAPVTGGALAAHTGVIEAHGGAVAFFLKHFTVIPGGAGASAMTLGHVVIALDERALDRSRSHERVHVRQCERWGPFFLPAYLLAALYLKLTGGHPYYDNPFEREAYANE